MARRSQALSAVQATARVQRISGTHRTPEISMARPSNGGKTMPPTIEEAIT